MKTQNNKILAKRILCILFTFTLILSMFPISPTYAVETGQGETKIKEENEITSEDSSEVISPISDWINMIEEDSGGEAESFEEKEQLDNLDTEETELPSDEIDEETDSTNVESDEEISDLSIDETNNLEDDIDNENFEENQYDNIIEQQESISFQPMAMNIANDYFTYTGNYDLVEYAAGKYYVRLLTSGTFTPKLAFKADAFLVGGGSGGAGGLAGYYGKGNLYTWCGMGGGGGYTTTVKNINVSSAIAVTIGAGGAGRIQGEHNLASKNGGTTTFGGYTVNGGAGNINSREGGIGGSNGGRGAYYVDDEYESRYPGSRYYSVSGASGTLAFGGDIAPFNSMYYGGGGGGGGTGSPWPAWAWRCGIAGWP